MNNFGYLIMDVAKELRYQLNVALEKEGITSAQWAVIAQLELSKDPLTSAQVAGIVGMDRRPLRESSNVWRPKSWLLSKLPVKIDGHVFSR